MHRFEFDSVRRTAPSRTRWLGVGFGLGLAAALALTVPERGRRTLSDARVRALASLHALTHRGVEARVPPPVTVSPPLPPAPTQLAPPPPPLPATIEGDTAQFIGPPAPPPRARAHAVAHGLVTVVCRPACDEVRDGARSLGSSPVFKRELRVGTHHLTLVTNEPRVVRRVDVVVNEEGVATVQEDMSED